MLDTYFDSQKFPLLSITLLACLIISAAVAVLSLVTIRAADAAETRGFFLRERAALVISNPS